jgi:hypothetical protein
MAVATDAASLLSQASCYACFGSSEYTLGLMKLVLLKQILLAKNPAAVTDPATLLSMANCFACFGSSEYVLKLMELSLLVQIVGP